MQYVVAALAARPFDNELEKFCHSVNRILRKTIWILKQNCV